MPIFLYRLAIACWLGGASLFTFVLTPAIFRSFNRDVAGGIVGVLFPGYFQWGLACGAIALATVFLAAAGRRRLISAGVISFMLVQTAIQAFVIEPKAAALKKEIPSFETTPPEDPLRVEFRKWHGVSAVANLTVIGGGIILVLLQHQTKNENIRRIRS